jgi:hypothetical protein
VWQDIADHASVKPENYVAIPVWGVVLSFLFLGCEFCVGCYGTLIGDKDYKIVAVTATQSFGMLALIPIFVLALVMNGRNGAKYAHEQKFAVIARSECLDSSFQISPDVITE